VTVTPDNKEPMTMKRHLLPLLTLLLVLLPALDTGAGVLHPGLEAWLDGQPDQRIEKVIVQLAERADIGAVDARLKIDRAPLALRHQTVIESLQAAARASQPALLSHLEQRTAAGEVVGHRAFWLENLVAVEATVREIRAIAARPEVEMVFIDYQIELIDPVSTPVLDKAEQRTDGPRAIENGIAAVRAPQAWAMGYTGAGRLVAHLDTGVDGNHPTLASRWRGLHAPASECWFDPVTGTDFPFDAGYHGTHTMGTICGWSASNEIGVARDAEWISAGVIDRVDIPTTMSDAVAAFQWLVDPDGDPGTTDDVPDVIGNSWGISPIYHGAYITGACDQTYWTVMDNCEAAGSVVVFAAGNEGPQTESLRTPADRADSPTNAFSVGSVNGNQAYPWPISSFSSRGPGCNGQIKPEVVAPGQNVRSAYPGGGFTTLSGTSMATPHVAGAVAILRQADPNLDAETIKTILMETARDLGDPGDDNKFGVGMIDIEQALLRVLGISTVEADLACSPGSGVLPFPASITATLTSLDLAVQRTAAARINVDLGSGPMITNWKVGTATLAPGASVPYVLGLTLPANPYLYGDNVLRLEMQDVSPPPYNQPPNSPSGHFDDALCVITGN
jgi:bacillopeptidase F